MHRIVHHVHQEWMDSSRVCFRCLHWTSRWPWLAYLTILAAAVQVAWAIHAISKTGFVRKNILKSSQDQVSKFNWRWSAIPRRYVKNYQNISKCTQMLAAGHGKNVVTSPWHLRFVPSSESQPGSWDRRISRSKSPCRRLNQRQHASLAGYQKCIRYDDTTTKLNCDMNTASSTSSKNIIKISKDIKGMLHKDRKNMQLSVTMSIDVSIFCSICWCWPWSEQLPILKIYSTLSLFGARVDRRANRIGTYRHQDFSSTRTQQSGIFHFVSHMFTSFQIFQVLFPIGGWEKDSGRKSISQQGFSAGGFR